VGDLGSLSRLLPKAPDLSWQLVDLILKLFVLLSCPQKLGPHPNQAPTNRLVQDAQVSWRIEIFKEFWMEINATWRMQSGHVVRVGLDRLDVSRRRGARVTGRLTRC
jgi:hypothetical protein